MMCCLRPLLVFYAFPPCCMLMAQAPPLETDRPDQTESPAIVPVGWLQVEAGFQREGSVVLDKPYVTTMLPASLTKLGLAPWLELRLIAEREEQDRDREPGAQGTWLPLELGAKFKLLIESGVVPRTSLIGHVGIPRSGAAEARPAGAFGNFRFTMQHTLSDRLALGYNLGAEWDGERPVAAAIYTVTLGAKLSDIWGAFGEAYGSISDVDAADHRLDAGVTCLIGKDLQLDASGGRSIGSDRWFISLGISFRISLYGSSIAVRT